MLDQVSGEAESVYRCRQKFLKGHGRPNIKEIWLDLGLLPKYVLHGGYDQITFCSTNVIPYQNSDKETIS